MFKHLYLIHNPICVAKTIKNKGSKMKTFNKITGIALIAASSLFATPKTYNADLSHSQIGFKVKHMVISTTKGHFDQFEGKIVWDSENLKNSNMEVTLQVASVNTNDEKRDTHLKANDFFDATKYPTIKFKSTGVEKSGDHFLVTGLLTMKDVTKEIVIPFTASKEIKDPWGMRRMGLEGEFTINRKDYNINFGAVMDNGGLMVSEDVKLEISVEAVRKP
jgi:polyisoprenoid-binding protein YceI